MVSQLGYVPGLDGLRALAVVAVIVYHADHRWLPGGYLGVEVFFVISGYLITLLLIGERERTGGVRLANFWKRRFRRLLPALGGMLVLLAAVLTIFRRATQWQVRGDFLGGIFYGSNWYQIWVGQGYAAGEAFAPLRHLWSLAVEEQFYLVWPLVMVLVMRRGLRRLPVVGAWLLVLSGVIALAVGFAFRGGDIALACDGTTHGYVRMLGRCINVNEGLYLGTFSRAGGLMLGAGAAMLWRPGAIMRGPLRSRHRTLDVIGVGGIAALGAMAWLLWLTGDGIDFGIRYNPWLFRGGFLLVGLATLAVIVAVTHPRSTLGRALGVAPIRWVGTRSYGLYLYHWPVFQLVRHEAAVPLRGMPLVWCVLATVVLTEASYRFVEAPIRRGRLGEWWRGERRARTERMRRRHRAIAGVTLGALAFVAFSTVSMSLADYRCITRQECDNQAAARALEEAGGGTHGSGGAGGAPQSTTGADGEPVLVTRFPNATTVGGTDPAPGDPSSADPAQQPGVGTPTDPANPAPPTASPPSTSDAPPAADPSLAEVPVLAIGESVMLGALPQLQAGGIEVDAQVSRQGIATAEVLEARRPMGAIPPVVVIQTGTNGSVSDATFARIMAQLPPEHAPIVVFLTVKAPKGWIEGNNAKIRALPDRYPNVRVVDWQAASAQIAGELSSSDGGVHLATTHAKQFYANLVFDAIGRGDLKR